MSYQITKTVGVFLIAIAFEYKPEFVLTIGFGNYALSIFLKRNT